MHCNGRVRAGSEPLRRVHVWAVPLSWQCYLRRTHLAPIFNASLSLFARVDATIALLTLEEKAGLIIMVSPGVPRLGIPAMNFWTAAQHGVGIDSTAPASSGPATGTLAQSWSPPLFRRMAAMAATEARARHNAAVHSGNRRGNRVSLTTFSPETNIVRTPLWSRAQESTGGEDPLLSALHAAAFVVGLQQGDAASAGGAPLLTASTCKDFVVYDRELNRETANVSLTARDLAETYMPPFIGCVQSADAAAVMLTYYAVQLPGQSAPTSAVVNAAHNDGLLRAGLNRGDSNSSLVVMCDCDAIADLISQRHVEPDAAHAAAAALEGGTDLELNIVPGGCGGNKCETLARDGNACDAAHAAVYACCSLPPRAGDTMFFSPSAPAVEIFLHDSRTCALLRSLLAPVAHALIQITCTRRRRTPFARASSLRALSTPPCAASSACACASASSTRPRPSPTTR